MFFNFFRRIPDLLIGIVIGGVAIWAVITNSYSTDAFVMFIIAVAIIIIIASMILYVVRKFFIPNISEDIATFLKSVKSKIGNIDRKYLKYTNIIEASISPITKSVKFIVIYLGISTTIGILIAISANLLLLATLTTQRIQIETLKEQNRKIELQNGLIANSTRIQLVNFYREQVIKIDKFVSDISEVMGQLNKDIPFDAWSNLGWSSEGILKGTTFGSFDRMINSCKNKKDSPANCSQMEKIDLEIIRKKIQNICKIDLANDILLFGTLKSSKFIECRKKLKSSGDSSIMSINYFLDVANSKLENIRKISEENQLLRNIKNGVNPYGLAECKIGHNEQKEFVTNWKTQTELLEYFGLIWKQKNSNRLEDGSSVFSGTSILFLQNFPSSFLLDGNLMSAYQSIDLKSGKFYMNLQNSLNLCLETRNSMIDKIVKNSKAL